MTNFSRNIQAILHYGQIIKSGSVLLKYIPKLDAMSYRFDFEIGHLIKSPCRECQGTINFPECADTCIILGRIQAILSEGISCTRRI